MRSITVATVICLAAVGCGKSSSGTSNGSPPVALSGTVNNHGGKNLGSKTSLDLEQDDFYFNPTFVKSTPGTAIHVTVKNEGTVAHTFTIDALGVDVTVDKGSSKDVTVTLPSSGAVAFYCKFHKGQGMQGAFYFKAGDTVGGGGPAATTSSSGDSGGAYGK